MWTDETKVELFGKAHYCTLYRKQNEAFKDVQTWWRFTDVVGVALLLLAPDALTVCMAS